MINDPSIAVHILADGDRLLNVSLKLSDTFSLHILNASPTLETSLNKWIKTYLDRKEVPFKRIPDGTPFQQKVWTSLSLIPLGKTQSYGELAQNIGHPNAQRAVGGACHRNPYPLLIPCHRVIQANKKIGGFGSDLEIKRRLLRFESGGIDSTL